MPPPYPQIYVQNTVQQNQQINVTPQIHLALRSRRTPFVLRAIWFLFIGWWLTGLIIALGYIAMLTVLGIPLALFLFHRIPQALTLRERTQSLKYETRGDATYITEGTMPQHAWYLRAFFFLLVGWWFGGVWLVVAYILSILILTLPVGVMMFNRAGAAFTLQRH